VSKALLETGYETASEFTAAYDAQFGGAPESKSAPPLYIDWIETPLGRMISIADGQSLYLLEFTNRKNMAGQISRLMRYYSRPIMAGATAISDLIRQELSLYFAGELTAFQTPLSLTGTEFQSRVWQALRDIPYGQTCSYAKLAQVIGSEKAVRAVASSNARNALAIIVPCHRVIGKNGKMTGYAGGVERKETLLRLEGALNALNGPLG
jgi:AraC family transcriptional regulator of adaptative response/methylated-DNA-[protein]-cysteine methyltransferase